MPRFRERPGDPHAALLARVMRRLQPSGGWREQWLRGYARNKLRMDGLYRTVLRVIPPASKVLDLGCGLGLLGLLLAERGTHDEVYGIEWDASKVRLAEALLHGLPNVRVVQGDLATRPWPDCSVIVLLDVIHYFPPDQQRTLLARVGLQLPMGGRLVLRVMDADAGGLSSLVRGVERAAVMFGWNQAPRVHWRPLSAILQDLDRVGFVGIDFSEDGSRLAGNRLLVFEKRTGVGG